MSTTQRLPDGALIAQRDAPVGGQAVLEGVMMRGVSTWAVAVRTPLPEEVTEDGIDPERGAHGEIEVTSFPLTSVLKKHRLLRLPIVRGVVALVESLVIGFKALGISANAQLPEEEKEISGGMWFGTVLVALVLAIGLFFVVPVGLTSLIKDQLDSSLLFWLVEGVVRTRSSSATCCCSRACATCAASSSTTAPSTRRSPATRRTSSSRPRTPSASAACTRAAGRASCSS